MERPKFSEMLANRRRQLGYSIRQASRVLRMREDVLIAFEEGDFDRMPKSGYAQGMLSSYARYLGLNPSDIVDTYAHDLERSKREERRRGRSRRGSANNSYRAGQPYVAPRRLLPTSGGLAGDMGSFATTRVHSRSGGQSDSSAETPEDTGSFDYQTAYPQGRPYTGRTPKRSRRSSRSSSSRRRSEISTMEVEGYDDDLYLGRDARPYESASSRSGRRSSRNISNSQRPRINRRTRQTGRGRGDRSRSDGRGGRQGGGSSGGILGGLFSHAGILIVGAVVIVLSLTIILSVNSCIRQDTNSARTVPVSEASKTAKGDTSSQADAASAKSGADDGGDNDLVDDAKDDDSSGESSKSSSSSKKETSVSVSVADGEVTWLEIECDGKSDVAQTITGPWQKTYTVEDAISIQAGNTTAVSVVRDGRQVQFDSMASGIGSIRIQGTKTTSSSSKDSKGKKSSEAKDDANSTTSSEGATSAKMGNASSSSSDSGKASDGKATDDTSSSESDSDDE